MEQQWQIRMKIDNCCYRILNFEIFTVVLLLLAELAVLVVQLLLVLTLALLVPVVFVVEFVHLDSVTNTLVSSYYFYYWIYKLMQM